MGISWASWAFFYHAMPMGTVIALQNFSGIGEEVASLTEKRNTSVRLAGDNQRMYQEECGSMCLMLTTSEKIITLKALLKRWPGATCKEIHDITGDIFHELNTYIHSKTVNNGIENIHYLVGIMIDIEYEFDSNGTMYFPNQKEYVFLASDVERVEKEHPDFLWKLVSIEEQEEGNKDLLQTLSEQDAVPAEHEPECANCEALRAENAALKAQIAEMERAKQEHSGSGAKPIDPREKNTLLAIAYAAIRLRNGVFPDRDLVSKLERTIQHELPEMEISARTIRNKLNDIKRIIK